MGKYDVEEGGLFQINGKDYFKYSEEEQVVGTFLDKPLYRKTIIGILNDSDTLLSGIGDIVNIYGTGNHSNSSYWRTIPYYEFWNGNSYTITAQKDGSNNVIFRSSSGGSSASANCKITIEYTKTTD
jgi:hypothetical protein